MSKSGWMRVILIAGSVLILVGVSLMIWMIQTEEERNVIEVRLEDGKTKSVHFDGLGLVPGDSCEYTIVLEAQSSKKYDLKLEFVETEEKTLKYYARVAILSGEELLYDELLVTAFEGDAIVLPVDFTEDMNTELTVVYYLPVTVGNEAKKAEAVFDLLITATNE